MYAHPRPPAPRAQSSALVSPNILHIDASQPRREWVREVLERAGSGFLLTQTASATEVASQLAERPYDAVVTAASDTLYAVLDAIHALDPNLPVVLLAGADTDALAAEALQRGATDYVVATDEHLGQLPRTLTAAIEKARLARAHAAAEQQLHARLAQQAAVVELGQQALAGTDVPVLMQEAAALVARTLNQNLCFVLELMPGGRLLRVSAGVGCRAGLIGRATISAGAHTLPGYTLFTGAPVLAEDLRTETRFDVPPLLAEHGVVGGMSVIIAGKDRPFGVLMVHSTRLEPFTRDDLHFLRAVANVLTTAIERKQSEERLLQSEARYRTLVEQARDVIFTLSATGRITTLNPAFEALTGFARKDWVGQPFLKLVHPEDLAAARTMYAPDAETPRPPASELRIRTRDGGFLVGEFSTQPHFNGAAGLVGIGRDISVRKSAEHALIAARDRAEEMSRLKSAFLTNMSHEFRTPLTSIIGFANILSGETEGEHRELSRLVEESGNRLLDTLNSVLDMAMLEAGSLQLDHRRLNVVEEVMDKARAHHRRAAEKGLRLHVRPAATHLEAELDRGCLDRILNNLIGNAIKFTARGEVTIDVRPLGDRIEISVTDTGVGICPKFVPHLFDAFKQENMGIDRPYEGTGLGLAITKKLVDVLNGDIQVRSEKGRGSTFVVSFPCATHSFEEAPTPHRDFSPTPAVPMAVQPRVLVLEDDPDMLVLVERFLEDGYQVVTASDEEAALQLARTHTLDVVLMDINLGRGRTGVEVLGALRAVPGYQKVPIVAVTAYALPGDREHFLKQGFDGYLGKPFTRRMLMRKIDQVLQD